MNDELARWNARYRELARSIPDQDGPDLADGDPDRSRFGPPAALQRLVDHLPRHGLSVDLAGGHGGAARFLAGLGLTPVLIDISDVALGIAADRSEAGGTDLTAIRFNLEEAELAAVLAAVERAVPDLPVTLVTCFHYLQRGLLASVARDLPPGATFAASIATVTNLERNPRPRAPFLLQPGELRRLVVGGPTGDGNDDANDDRSGGGPRLEVLYDREGWNEPGHHEAELVVRKPAGRP